MPVPRQPFQWRSCALTLDAPTAGWNVGRTAIRCVLSVVTPNATERNARGIAPRRSTIRVASDPPRIVSDALAPRPAVGEWPPGPVGQSGSRPMEVRHIPGEKALSARSQGPGWTRKGEKIGLSRLTAARKVRTRILEGIFRGTT